MDSQVESAIELAFNPSTDQNLKGQAYQFLTVLREDPNAWQVCLTLFIRQPSPSEVVRLVCLEIVNSAVQTQRLDQNGLNEVRHRLMEYIRSYCYSACSARRYCCILRAYVPIDMLSPEDLDLTESCGHQIIGAPFARALSVDFREGPIVLNLAVKASDICLPDLVQRRRSLYRLDLCCC